jgi:hypothetical protein
MAITSLGWKSGEGYDAVQDSVTGRRYYVTPQGMYLDPQTGAAVAAPAGAGPGPGQAGPPGGAVSSAPQTPTDRGPMAHGGPAMVYQPGGYPQMPGYPGGGMRGIDPGYRMAPDFWSGPQPTPMPGGNEPYGSGGRSDGDRAWLGGSPWGDYMQGRGWSGAYAGGMPAGLGQGPTQGWGNEMRYQGPQPSGGGQPSTLPQVPLPHQVNPAVWDSLSRTGRGLALGAAGAGGWDTQDYEDTINQTRPRGYARQASQYGYRAPRSGYQGGM